MIWRPTTLVIAAGAIFWKVEAWRRERGRVKRERIRGREVFMRGRGSFSFFVDRSLLWLAAKRCSSASHQSTLAVHLCSHSLLKCFKDIRGSRLERGASMKRCQGRREREEKLACSFFLLVVALFFFDSFLFSLFFRKLTRNDRGSSGLARTASLTAASTCLLRDGKG